MSPRHTNKAHSGAFNAFSRKTGKYGITIATNPCFSGVFEWDKPVFGGEKHPFRAATGWAENSSKYFHETVDGVWNFCNSGSTHGKTQTTYMRTIKTLVCVAALATGLATAMAQSNVYSLNVVGYYNVTVDAGKLFMIANQLNTTNNQIQYVLPTVADFTSLFKYINGGYQTATFTGGWDQPTWTLNPGETAMLQNDEPAAQVITFVGEVLQGALPNTLATDPSVDILCFRSSMVPQQGTPVDFGIPAEDFDTIFVYNDGYASDTFSGGVWGLGGGNGPTIKVGQGFGYQKAAGNVSSSWIRNFTVQ
jgi:hypothetical protein